MDPALAWAIVGLGLVISELLTGTFYLLMLALAAFGAAGAAWLNQSFPVQCIVGVVVAAAGCYGVHLYRVKNKQEQMPQIDTGMPAAFEGWIDAGERRARVRYRGATWEARVLDNEGLEPGTTLYVAAVDGNTLKVTTKHP